MISGSHDHHSKIIVDRVNDQLCVEPSPQLPMSEPPPAPLSLHTQIEDLRNRAQPTINRHLIISERGSEEGN